LKEATNAPAAHLISQQRLRSDYVNLESHLAAQRREEWDIALPMAAKGEVGTYPKRSQAKCLPEVADELLRWCASGSWAEGIDNGKVQAQILQQIEPFLQGCQVRVASSGAQNSRWMGMKGEYTG
jgi:hypothetical protein